MTHKQAIVYQAARQLVYQQQKINIDFADVVRHTGMDAEEVKECIYELAKTDKVRISTLKNV
jgi:hypothetical protein